MRVPGFRSRRPSQHPRSQIRKPDEAAPMDAVALTLAVWLGLITCVTGVIRLSDNAAAQAALARGSNSASQQIDASQTFAMAAAPGL